MKNVKRFIYIFFVVILILPKAVSAIGVMTQPIVVKDVLRGREIKESLNLHNNKNFDITFELGAGGDIKDWVSYYKLDNPDKIIEKTLAPASSWHETGVLIKVPADTPNGIYTGFLTALYKPELIQDDTKSVATVAQKFMRKATITVTDQEIISFFTRANPETYALKDNQPLQIQVFYTNNGNISIKPQAQIKVFDLQNKTKEIFNAVYPYPGSEEPVKPLETKKIIIPYSTNGLSQGEYKVSVIVSLGDIQQFEDDFTFVINDSGKVLGDSVSSNIFKWTIIALIFLVTIMAIVIIVSRLKLKKNKNS